VNGKGFDEPRLRTAIGGMMSTKKDDTRAALEILDGLRAGGADLSTFWTDQIAPLSSRWTWSRDSSSFARPLDVPARTEATASLPALRCNDASVVGDSLAGLS
jgi:hypothetical protein